MNYNRGFKDYESSDTIRQRIKEDEAMLTCPYCIQEINELFYSPRKNLIFDSGNWDIDPSDYESVIVCPACYQELGLKDLDNLGVPQEYR